MILEYFSFSSNHFLPSIVIFLWHTIETPEKPQLSPTFKVAFGPTENEHGLKIPGRREYPGTSVQNH